MKRKIIVIPCMEKSWSKVSGPTTSFLGSASWRRMISAWIPPARKNAKPVTR